MLRTSSSGASPKQRESKSFHLSGEQLSNLKLMVNEAEESGSDGEHSPNNMQKRMDSAISVAAVENTNSIGYGIYCLVLIVATNMFRYFVMMAMPIFYGMTDEDGN